MKRCTCGPQEGCTEPCDRNISIDELLFQLQVRNKLIDQQAAEIKRQRGSIADLMYAGNQLARATQDSMQRRDDLTIAWYQAVENAIPEHAKPVVCRSDSRC